ncbi:unnamed protein product [Effrenium voratum]|uniref:non-specific serine/threonine protein kinase n=1 Tax=Effrenium voratum TaxID=2562239 RepID=A0AA36NK96_9DINO|nr:unnamed protein product [Effrenium voratum]
MAWLWGASCRFTVAGREVIQESLIADGGFAYVYRGRDAQTGEALAIRRALLQDAEAHQAAQLEMTLLLRLPHHDHVVRFLGADVVEGTGAPGPSKTQAVSLFELCTGGTLFARVEAVVERARAGPHMRYCCPCLPEAEALAALSGTASALHHLHAHRIIHYDVKSENLMLGSDGRWKLGDFGSASGDLQVLDAKRPVVARRLRGERSFDLQGAPRKLLLEAEAFVHGRCTPIFRAPEVADVHLRWPIGPKADMFSLGCVLFACLTGIHPFPMDSALANIQAKYHLPPESDAYSEVILRWLRQLLQREPQHRPDATTLARQVEAFVSGGSVPAEKVDVEAAVVEDWVADFSQLPSADLAVEVGLIDVPYCDREGAASIACETSKSERPAEALPGKQERSSTPAPTDVPVSPRPEPENNGTLPHSEVPQVTDAECDAGDIPDDEASHPIPRVSNSGLAREVQTEARVKVPRKRRPVPCLCASIRTRD